MIRPQTADIVQPIKGYLAEFEDAFGKALTGNSDVLNRALTHLQKSSGKHFRPIMLGLCAEMCGGPTNDQTVASALVIELLHSASLIHDDVIDFSDTRRGQPTLSAIYGNHQAVLMGDFVLSTAFLEIVSRCRSQEMLRTVAMAGRMLSEGELMQLTFSQQQDYSEEHYMAMINRKTASLFEASGLLGAMSVQAGEEKQERCRHLGQIVGQAFQMTDDLFDYDKRLDVGKPTGHDLIEGKVSLPLIYVLEHASETDRRALLEKLQQPITPHTIDDLLSIAKERGGIAYTERRVQGLLREAQSILDLFGDSPAQRSMKLLVAYVGSRKS